MRARPNRVQPRTPAPAGVPTAPGTPTVTLVDPSVRVVFTKSDSTAVKYSAFVKPASGAEVEVPLAVKPVTGSPNQLFALVAPDAPELPQGGTYTLQVGRAGVCLQAALRVGAQGGASGATPQMQVLCTGVACTPFAPH